MVTEDDVVNIAVLRKDLKHFVHFANRNGLSIYRPNKNGGFELLKLALTSPVLEKLTEGLINIYRDVNREEYVDVDAEEVEDEDEFDLPPSEGKNEEEVEGEG